MRLYAVPDHIQYEITKERRVLSEPEKKKSKVRIIHLCLKYSGIYRRWPF